MSIKIYVKYVKNNRDFYTTKMNLPTGNLDSKSGGEVMKMLCDLRAKMKKTLIVITHDPHIAEMAERRFTIIDGVLSEVTVR